jgi:hypothetical protein
MILFSIYDDLWMCRMISEASKTLDSEVLFCCWNDGHRRMKELGHSNFIDVMSVCGLQPSEGFIREKLKLSFPSDERPYFWLPQYEKDVIAKAMRAWGAVERIITDFSPDALAIWNNLSYQGKFFGDHAPEFVKRIAFERGPLPNTIQAGKGILADLGIDSRINPSDSSVNRAALLIKDYKDKTSHAWPEDVRCTRQPIPPEVYKIDRPIILVLGQVGYDTQIIHHSDFGWDYQRFWKLINNSWDRKAAQVVIKLHPTHTYPHMDDGAFRIDGAIVTDAGDIRDWFQLPQLARVVTVNSSASFESLLYGIPTVTLGRNWYTGLTAIGESYLPTFMNDAVRPADPDRPSWSAAVYQLARGIEQKKFFLSGADFGRHLNTVL